MSVILSCLFIATLWSPAGKGLTSLSKVLATTNSEPGLAMRPTWKGLTSELFFVMCYYTFVTFPCSILGQVWYLTVLNTDLCPLSYYFTRSMAV